MPGRGFARDPAYPAAARESVTESGPGALGACAIYRAFTARPGCRTLWIHAVRRLHAMNASSAPAQRRLPWLVVLLCCWLAGAALAQPATPARVADAEGDPPARVASVTDRAGSVVFAPAGEQEWVDLPPNRPLTVGDRLWSDAGARAELHLGTATLHLDEQSHLGISALDTQAAQLILLQGTANARVRELAAGDNFEIDTPHVALRAEQPGDYRVEVEPQGGHTRVTVRSGAATIYGEDGQAMRLAAGQSQAFAGRALAQVDAPPAARDAFAQWVEQRNRAEDQSVAARHVPRAVVGYPQLDAHGTWSQDATYGTVWYPRVASADWAPYRDGRWEWIAPWGWTWIDQAPWGFAPFHYGRWATIGSRWAWVPGPLAARPAYAPALVAFFGDGTTSFSLNIGNGPGVGWYPLAPGEAWWPSYRASTRYVGWLNPRIDLRRQHRDAWERHQHRRHAHAITAVAIDDFRRGRAVREHWRSVNPAGLRGAQFGVTPQRPERRWQGGERVPQVAAPRWQAQDRAVWEQRRAQREQWQLQERAGREQRQLQERTERTQRQQPWQAGREQQQSQDRGRRELQERAWRDARREQDDRERWRRDDGRDGWRGRGDDADARGRHRGDDRSVRSVEQRQRIQPVQPHFQPQLTLPPAATEVNPPARQRGARIGGRDEERRERGHQER